MIELTEQQIQTIPAIGSEPVQVVDRRTGRRFFLIGQPQFEDWQRWTAIEEARASIPPGVLRSMEAFWCDLQGLLTRWRRRGKFVLYQHEWQVAFARSIPALEQERIRRGIPDREYYIGQVVPHHESPWAPEEMDIGHIDFDDEQEPIASLKPGATN
jgi:hypothetical protein